MHFDHYSSIREGPQKKIQSLIQFEDESFFKKKSSLSILVLTIYSVFLSVELSDVEFEFSSFKDVSITSARLSGSGGDTSQQSTSAELFLDLLINETVSVLSSGDNVFGDLSMFLTFLLLTELLTVVLLEELPEGGSINFNDGILDEGLGSDEFVV